MSDYKLDLPEDFNVKNYIELYEDLKNMSEKAAKIHYCTYGKNENRTYKLYLPEDFNVKNYIELNEDLKNMSEKAAKIHYCTYGKNENRTYKFYLPEHFKSNDTLLHKIKLNICSNNLYYDIKFNDFNINNNNLCICHIHILNITNFIDVFEKYYNLIINKIPIIITYSFGEISKIILDIKNIIILKINNKGYDIGGKIILYDYLKKNNINYDFIFFIHSKSNVDKRTNYLDPFLKNKNRFDLIETLLKIKNTNLLGIFPNNMWYNINYKKNYNNDDLYISNKYYYYEILNYLNCTNYDKIFAEGNIMILSKKVLDFVFEKNYELFYNLLNEDNSFDYNWFKIYYKEFSNLSMIAAYNLYKKEGLYGNNTIIKNTDKSIPDGMFEHVFERIWINVIKHLDGNYLVLDKDNLINLYDIKLNAIYFPQFHSIPENDNFWGKDFTEWTLLKPYNNSITINNENYNILKPHEDIGYYDLSDKNVIKNQISIANKFGINGFIIYHYWFKNNHKILYKPKENFLDDDINFPFCLSWANETWSRRWDGTNNEVLLEQDYGNINDYIAHINYLIPFFKNKNYIKNNNGECIFYIYNISDIQDSNNMISIWEKELDNNHIKIKVIATNNCTKKNHDSSYNYDRFLFEPLNSLNYTKINSNTNDYIKLFKEKKLTINDFDFEYYFENNIDIVNAFNKNKNKTFDHFMSHGINEYRDIRIKNDTALLYRNLDYLDMINSYCDINYTKKNYHLGLALSWNNIIRRKNKKFLYVSNFSIENLNKMLILNISHIVLRYLNIFDLNDVKKLNHENFININAWNEWNEQAVLEPNNISGYENLETIKNIIFNL